jgi:hypothetical protein
MLPHQASFCCIVALLYNRLAWLIYITHMLFRALLVGCWCMMSTAYPWQQHCIKCSCIGNICSGVLLSVPCTSQFTAIASVLRRLLAALLGLAGHHIHVFTVHCCCFGCCRGRDAAALQSSIDEVNRALLRHGLPFGAKAAEPQPLTAYPFSHDAGVRTDWLLDSVVF